MGACNRKSEKKSSAFPSCFSNFTYLNRSNRTILSLKQNKPKKFKIKSPFFCSQDSAVAHLSKKRILVVGGSSHDSLSAACTIIHISNLKTQKISDLPYPMRLGNLHELQEWIYYIGGHLSISLRLAGPIIRYNQSLNVWNEIGELKIETLSSSCATLLNFGSCVMGKNILVFGGECYCDEGIESNQNVYSVYVEDGVRAEKIAVFPIKLAFPVVAAGNRHAVIAGGVNLRNFKWNKRTYYAVFKEHAFTIDKLDSVKIEIVENYPPVYNEEFALFVSYPNAVVRFKKQSCWNTYALKSKDKEHNHLDRLETFKSYLVRRPPHEMDEETKDKNLSIASSDSISKSIKANLNEKKQSVRGPDEITKIDSHQHPTKPTQNNEKKESAEKIPKIIISKLDSEFEQEGENMIETEKTENFSEAALKLESGSEQKRKSNELVVTRHSPAHVKALNSPDILKLEGSNSANKVEITIRRVSGEGKTKTEYVIRKESSYSDCESDSSSDDISAKEIQLLSVSSSREELNEPCTIDEYLGITPRPSFSILDNRISKEELSESSSESSDEESFERGFRLDDETIGIKNNIASLSFSELSDEKNDKNICFSFYQYEKLFDIISKCFGFIPESFGSDTGNVFEIKCWLIQVLPDKQYFIEKDLSDILEQIHKVASRAPLNKIEKRKIILSSKLGQGRDEIDRIQYAYAISRAFKYILLRKQ